MLIKIVMGAILGFIIWKLLKITLKVVFWLFLIGLAVAFVLPGGLLLLGGTGVILLSILGSLTFLGIASLIFVETS